MASWGHCKVAVLPPVTEEQDMAGKDKGGRAKKTEAASTPKEKRDAKRAKRDAKAQDARNNDR